MADVIGIVGSRRRNSETDYDLMVRAFDKLYHKGDWIVSGGCQEGADHFAEDLSDERLIPMIIHTAQWDIYGKQAGTIRNSDIAADCTVLIALCASDRKEGTEDTVRKAKNQGKNIILT